MSEGRPLPPRVLETLAAKHAATRIAIVGASNDPEKYGNIIVRNLAAKGYTLLPVNPRGGTIEGLESFRSLADITEPPELVVFVTPPRVTETVLREAPRTLLRSVWLQDGAYDRAVLEVAHAVAGDVVHDACVMVVSNQ